MKNKWLVILSVVVVFAFLALNVRGGSIETANAAPRDGVYDISWYTVDGGGAQDLSGGSYSLSGTIGQPDAGALSGGAYSLNGGFWSSGAANLLRFFLPAIVKNP
jgi:hypothetical protein